MRISRIRLSLKLSPWVESLRLSAATPPSGPASVVVGKLISVVVLVDKRFSFLCQKHASGAAPWLHPRYGTSSLLWAAPTPVKAVLEVMHSSKNRLRTARLGASRCLTHAQMRLQRVSQVPRPIFRHTLPPTTPKSPLAAFAHCFTSDTALHLDWKTGDSCLN